MKPVLTRVLRILGIGTTLALAPVSYARDRGLHENTAACQNGTCCPEMLSICGLNGVNHYNYYYKSEGSCKEVAPNTPG